MHESHLPHSKRRNALNQIQLWTVLHLLLPGGIKYKLWVLGFLLMHHKTISSHSSCRVCFSISWKYPNNTFYFLQRMLCRSLKCWHHHLVAMCDVTKTDTHLYWPQAVGVWWPEAEESPAVVFVAAVISSFLLESTSAGKEIIKKINPQTAAPLPWDSSTPHHAFLSLSLFSFFFNITRSWMSAWSGAVRHFRIHRRASNERACCRSLFFSLFLTFYLVLFNWLAVWRRNGEGERGDGAERKVMFLDVGDSCGRAVMKK